MEKELQEKIDRLMAEFSFLDDVKCIKEGPSWKGARVFCFEFKRPLCIGPHCIFVKDGEAKWSEIDEAFEYLRFCFSTQTKKA